MRYSELPDDLRLHIANNFPPADTAESRVLIGEGGLTAVWDAGRTLLSPVGCSLCFQGVYGQDDDANPTLRGITLLRAEQDTKHAGSLGPSVRANLWLCPQCRIPQARLLPKFQ